MNTLVKTESRAVATNGAPRRNVYTEAAQTLAPKNILGQFLKFTKGRYYVGQAGQEIPLGTKLAAIMDRMSQGFVRWEGARPSDTRMVVLSTGDKPPNRGTLGDLDKELWEADDQGNPKDPWQETVYLPLISTKGEIYTFTTSSVGGRNAAGALLDTYGRIADIDKEYPVVKLGATRYQHSNKRLGWIDTPVFEVIDYTDKGRFATVLASPAPLGGAVAPEEFSEVNPPPLTSAPASSKTVLTSQQDFSDDIPF